jgi:hypothetical protein
MNFDKIWVKYYGNLTVLRFQKTPTLQNFFYADFNKKHMSLARNVCSSLHRGTYLVDETCIGITNEVMKLRS